MRGAKRTIGANALLLLAGLLLLEVFFGNWFVEDKLSNLNLVRSRTITYDLDGLYASPTGKVVYRRDAYGLRGRYASVASIGLLTVGGSTTDQRYLSEGQTWQDVLQDRFAAAGRPLSVANAGVDGQTTYGHIKNFEYWFPFVPGLRPERILLYVGLNDLFVEEGYGFDRLREDAGGSVLSRLRSNSALYRLARTVRGMVRAGRIRHRALDLAAVAYTRQPLRGDYSFMSKRRSEYRERLLVLLGQIRAFGATPVIVTQPSRRYRFAGGVLEGSETTELYDGLRINGVDYYHMKAELDEAALGVCKEQGVACIDLGKERFWEDADFYDFEHMTPSGARKVGEYLFEALTSGTGMAVSGG